MMTIPAWIKAFFPPVAFGTVVNPPRGKLRFSGAAVTSVTDDPANDQTIVDIGGGSAAAVDPELGMMVASPASGYASATGAHGADTFSTAQVRFVVLAQPSVALRNLASYTIAGAEGWAFATEDTLANGVTGQLECYVALDGALRRIGRHHITPENVGKLYTATLTLRAGFAHFYVNGREVADNQSGNYGPGRAFTTYTKPTGESLRIGGNSSPAAPCEQGIVEVCMSPLALTDEQVLAAARAPVGTPLPGANHYYRASDAGGATWLDAIVGAPANLTRAGSISVVTTRKAPVQNARTWHVWGDSVAAGRQAGGTGGDGWRRELARICALAGKPIAYVGTTAPNASAQPDYDYWHNATGGERLADRVSTFAADIASYGTAGAGLLIAYGFNDLFVSTGRTAAQIVADIKTACSLWVARHGLDSPILVAGLYVPRSDQGTVGQFAELNTFISQEGALERALQRLGYRARVASVASIITDPTDSEQLFDGIHLTHGSNLSYAAALAPKALELMS